MKGHGKGSSFERKIAKEIIKEFRKKYKYLEQRDCWRSVLSGGHDMSAGDLRYSERMAKLFPFAIECKHRKKIRWQNLFMMKTTEEKRWIKQAQEGAVKIKGFTPVLVLKSNDYKQILALVGPKSEVHDNGPEIYFPSDWPWKLMPWKKFLKLAVESAGK